MTQSLSFPRDSTARSHNVKSTPFCASASAFILVHCNPRHYATLCKVFEHRMAGRWKSGWHHFVSSKWYNYIYPWSFTTLYQHCVSLGCHPPSPNSLSELRSFHFPFNACWSGRRGFHKSSRKWRKWDLPTTFAALNFSELQTRLRAGIWSRPGGENGGRLK